MIKNIFYIYFKMYKCMYLLIQVKAFFQFIYEIQKL